MLHPHMPCTNDSSTVMASTRRRIGQDATSIPSAGVLGITARLLNTAHYWKNITSSTKPEVRITSYNAAGAELNHGNRQHARKIL